jgi:hypothetical protein
MDLIQHLLRKKWKDILFFLATLIVVAVIAEYWHSIELQKVQTKPHVVGKILDAWTTPSGRYGSWREGRVAFEVTENGKKVNCEVVTRIGLSWETSLQAGDAIDVVALGGCDFLIDRVVRGWGGGT